MTTSTMGPADSGFQSCLIWLASSVLLLMCFPYETLGCFPTKDVFKESCQWTQATSLTSWMRISLCPEHRGFQDGTPMKIESENFDGRVANTTLDCLKSYGGHRYMVRVRKSNKTLGYQCLKFSPLSERVVRQAKSRLVEAEDQLNCRRDISYKLDEAVLIATTISLQPRPCPLSGGFQMRMSLGEKTLVDCLASVHSYRPRLQFQCDQLGSSRVLADLGRQCTSWMLSSSKQLLGQHSAPLHCLDSWQEKAGTPEEFISVLMGMRDSPYTYWCLHLKQNMSGRAGEIIYEAFLTFDGRCMQEFSGNWDLSKETSMFGHLVTFVPANDRRCFEKSYLEGCQGFEDQKCTQSFDCPHSCDRCMEELELERCSFVEGMRGSWEAFGDTPRLTVSGNTVFSPSFGKFQCRAPMELGTAKGLYPLVQTGAASTCTPYYSCAQIMSLAPGLLSFQMRPARKDKDFGTLYSCQETYSQLRGIRPERAEETVTLMNRIKLQGVPCQLEKSQSYLTVALDLGCRLVVGECSGPCKTFNISLDTCNNRTAEETGLLTQHECLARVSFEYGLQAILTRASDTEEYRCWLFREATILLTRAEKCNQASIDDIFEYEYEPYRRYDPVYLLIRSMSNSYNEGNHVVSSVSLVGISAFFSWFVLTKAGL